MDIILSNYSASVTELKKSPTKLLNEVDEPIAILNHNKPSAYLVPSDIYKNMIEIVDDYMFAKEVVKELDYSDDDLIEVDVDELV